MPTAPSKLWTPLLVALIILWAYLSFRLAQPQTIVLGYNVPKINPCLRRDNDCAQIATYIVMANEGGRVGREAFADLFENHRDSGTPISGWVKTARREFRATYHRAGAERDLIRNLQTGVAPMIVAWIPSRAGGVEGHGMVLTGYSNAGGAERWQIADARGKRWVDDSKFNDLWSGQWVETGGKS